VDGSCIVSLEKNKLDIGFCINAEAIIIDANANNIYFKGKNKRADGCCINAKGIIIGANTKNTFVGGESRSDLDGVTKVKDIISSVDIISFAKVYYLFQIGVIFVLEGLGFEKLGQGCSIILLTFILHPQV